MEKKNNRPLILSIITLMICIALLIGATMAWFTDTETNTGNRIQAGTLDAKLYKYTGAEGSQTTGLASGWTQITDDTASDFIFNFDPEEGWQPGDTKTIYLAVENAGSLKFDYNIDLIVEDDALADALQVSITYAQNELPATATSYQTISSLIDVDENGDALKEKTGNIYLAQTGLLAATYIDYIKVEIKLDESSGASYPGDAFEMDLILTATQEEQDDTIVKAYTAEDIANLDSGDTDKTVILMNDITINDDVDLGFNVNFDLNGYTLTCKLFKMYTTDYCTVDIANGTITTTVDDIDIQLPNGTINVGSTILAASGKHIFDASTSTLNLTSTTQLVGVKDDSGTIVANLNETKKATIMTNTRVVVDTEKDVHLNIPDATGIAIENTESEGEAVVTGDDIENVLVDGEPAVEYVEVTSATEFTQALASDNKYISITASSLTTKTWAFDSLTIPEGYVVRINADASSFKITVSGDLTNNGTIKNYSYEDSCYAWWMTVGDEFINNGTLSDYALCLTVEDGTNNGTLELYQFSVLDEFTNSADKDLTVHGTLSGDDTEKVASTLDNNGTITFYSSTGFNARYIILNNYGVVHAESLAFITGHHYNGSTSAVGEINNYGTWYGTTTQGCGNCKTGVSSSDNHILGCDHGITFTTLEGGTVVPNSED